MEEIIINNVYYSVGCWIVLFISDYYLTIYSAKIYKRNTNKYFEFEGSFELTPYFQKEIDELKKISPRFIFILVFFTLLLTVVWFLSFQFIMIPEIYHFFWGGLVISQLTIHIRHFKNIFYYKNISTKNAV